MGAGADRELFALVRGLADDSDPITNGNGSLMRILPLVLHTICPRPWRSGGSGSKPDINAEFDHSLAGGASRWAMTL